MTLDTNDLREAFREQAATLTHIPDFASSAAARGRRTQQRRAIVGIAGVAVVVAGILGITQLGGSPHRAAVPATPKGFATYSSGMKLVEAKQGASPLDFTVTLPATPDGKPVAVGVSLSCASPSAPKYTGHLDPEINVSINGEQEGAVGGCDKTFPPTSGVTISWQPSDKSFAPGATLHVAVNLSGKKVPDAQVRVGVYAAVPLDQYVFPSPPGHLGTVTRSDMAPQGKVLGTVKAGPDTALVVHPTHGLAFNTRTVEPGHLDIYVNGKLVRTAYSWTYEDSGSFGEALTLRQLGLKAGQAARITVVPTRYTGRTWVVAIVDRSTG